MPALFECVARWPLVCWCGLMGLLAGLGAAGLSAGVTITLDLRSFVVPTHPTAARHAAVRAAGAGAVAATNALIVAGRIPDLAGVRLRGGGGAFLWGRGEGGEGGLAAERSALSHPLPERVITGAPTPRVVG